MATFELRKIGLAFALAFPTLVLTAASAFAQCSPAAPVNNTTVTCTGTVTNQNSPNGYGTGAENGLPFALDGRLRARWRRLGFARLGRGLALRPRRRLHE
jgi:hypothetical protein